MNETNDAPPAHRAKSQISPTWKAVALIGTGIALGSMAVWLGITHPWQTNPSPFTPAVTAAVKFPLYYPANLPDGFHIDKQSVSQPTAGVVLFQLTGPNGAKIYISQEARPAKYDLGGFYKKLSDEKEVVVSDGSVAFGRDGKTEIVSRANNHTWILANTSAPIPESQMIDMLKTIKPAF